MRLYLATRQSNGAELNLSQEKNQIFFLYLIRLILCLLLFLWYVLAFFLLFSLSCEFDFADCVSYIDCVCVCVVVIIGIVMLLLSVQHPTHHMACVSKRNSFVFIGNWEHKAFLLFFFFCLFLFLCCCYQKREHVYDDKGYEWIFIYIFFLFIVAKTVVGRGNFEYKVGLKR